MELDGDLETATLLLDQQFEELRDARDMVLAEHPRLQVLYRRFHHKNPTAVKRAVREHLSSLERAIADEERVRLEVTTLKDLKVVLEDRRSFGMLEEIDVIARFFQD